MATPDEAARTSVEPIAMEVENLKPIERFGWGVRARPAATRRDQHSRV